MSLTMLEDNHEVDEEAPLLPDHKIPSDSNPAQTSLPIAQLSVLLTVWLAESIICQSINPYLNQVLYALSPIYQC